MQVKKSGKQRVIIEAVRPQVDGGRFPAKRTIGEDVTVTANVFADGHDVIRGRIRYRKAGSRNWNFTELVLKENDEWMGQFRVTELGAYQFTVEAWIDHLSTWFDGIVKKIGADLNVSLELLEGADLIQEIITIYSREDTDYINQAMAAFRDASRYSDAIAEVLSKPFSEFVRRCPLVLNESIYDKVLYIWVEQKKCLFSTWYELFPRSAKMKGKGHGTFKDVEKLLPRIKEMGFDVLYLPPIHPIGKVNRKGKNNKVKAGRNDPGSPWGIGSSVGGHKDILAELGSLKDYKDLIRKAKNLGIDIALDLAYQCAPDHPYVKSHPEWFRWRPDGTVKYAENPPKKYQDILPINFESDQWEPLWEELKSVVDYWIKQGVRIFRVDNPHTKPLRFWEWLLGEITKSHPDIIFLAEAFTRPKIMASLAKVGFQQSYTYFTWRVSKHEIMEYMTELTQTESRDYFRPNFWPNTPDILPFHLQNAGENEFITRYILAATLSSNYGIYGPVFEFYENQPMGVREEYLNSEKYEIRKHDWSKVTRLSEIITIVNGVRKEHPSLQSTWNLEFCEINNDQILTYIKTTPDLEDIILMVVNLDPQNIQSGYLRLPWEKLKVDRDAINIKLHEFISGDNYTWTHEWNYAQIDPNQIPFHFFKVEVRESNS